MTVTGAAKPRPRLRMRSSSCRSAGCASKPARLRPSCYPQKKPAALENTSCLQKPGNKTVSKIKTWTVSSFKTPEAFEEDSVLKAPAGSSRICLRCNSELQHPTKGSPSPFPREKPLSVSCSKYQVVAQDPELIIGWGKADTREFKSWKSKPARPLPPG